MHADIRGSAQISGRLRCRQPAASRSTPADNIACPRSSFRFGLIYISLDPPELSPLPVSERAAKGGHDVDPATAVARHHRSHDELRWFAPQADLLMVFDNSAPTGAPVLLASRSPGQPLRHHLAGINPAVDRAMLAKTV